MPPENPSVVGWSRLEPVPATGDLEPGLQAPVADPLWLLARQWQFGELHGDDAGSPVEVHLRGEAATLSRYLAGPLGPGAAGRAVDAAGLAAPLEPVVEAEPVRADSDRLRTEAGLHFMRLLGAAGLSVDLRDAYRTHYRGPRPVLGAPVLDGGLLASDLEPLADADGNLAGLPPLPALDPPDADAVRPVAEGWLRWWRAQVYEPARPAAWNANRMEYALAVQADLGGDSVVLTADEYAGGRLDWYSFDLASGASLGPPATPLPVQQIESVTLPARATYPGMPADRLWQFEDARVFLGRTAAGPTDLARMLLVEFALGFGNDWYVTPVELPAGSVFRLTALTVRDTFGIETQVPPSVDLDGQRWTMFSTAGATGRDVYFLPPTLPSTLEADPLEEVALFRDEMANLVWGVERVVAGPTGERVERAREPGRAALRQQLPGDLGDAQLIYRLMTPVPDHWIPFVPVPAEGVPAAEGAVELLRGAILRFRADGTSDLAHPHGVLLRANPAADPAEDRLRLLEEEVPRAGVVVRRLLQLARTPDGRTVVWLGRDKGAGRGEGSSGMRFDAVDPPS